MIILAIRTDKPEAELGLFQGNERLAYETWQAHRELAETIHYKIQAMLEAQTKSIEDVAGVVVFRGPGSFTGLRIGLSVANALASGLKIPIVGSSGEDWLAAGVQKLQDGSNEQAVIPDYGAPVHITERKK
jgi:tRNA threonylcarbamoyladenosine biosynthesis protein TsaB